MSWFGFGKKTKSTDSIGLDDVDGFAVSVSKQHGTPEEEQEPTEPLVVLQQEEQQQEQEQPATTRSVEDDLFSASSCSSSSKSVSSDDDDDDDKDEDDLPMDDFDDDTTLDSDAPFFDEQAYADEEEEEDDQSFDLVAKAARAHDILNVLMQTSSSSFQVSSAGDDNDDNNNDNTKDPAVTKNNKRIPRPKKPAATAIAVTDNDNDNDDSVGSSSSHEPDAASAATLPQHHADAADSTTRPPQPYWGVRQPDQRRDIAGGDDTDVSDSQGEFGDELIFELRDSVLSPGNFEKDDDTAAHDLSQQSHGHDRPNIVRSRQSDNSVDDDNEPRNNTNDSSSWGSGEGQDDAASRHSGSHDDNREPDDALSRHSRDYDDEDDAPILQFSEESADEPWARLSSSAGHFADTAGAMRESEFAAGAQESGNTFGFHESGDTFTSRGLDRRMGFDESGNTFADGDFEGDFQDSSNTFASQKAANSGFNKSSQHSSTLGDVQESEINGLDESHNDSAQKDFDDDLSEKDFGDSCSTFPDEYRDSKYFGESGGQFGGEVAIANTVDVGNDFEDDLHPSERDYYESGNALENELDSSDRSSQRDCTDSGHEDFSGADFADNDEFWDHSNGSHAESIENEDPLLKSLHEHLGSDAGSSFNENSLLCIEEVSCESGYTAENAKDGPENALLEFVEEGAIKNMDTLLENGDWDGIINAAAGYGGRRRVKREKSMDSLQLNAQIEALASGSWAAGSEDEEAGGGSEDGSSVQSHLVEDESSEHSDDPSASREVGERPKESPGSHLALAQKLLNGDFEDDPISYYDGDAGPFEAGVDDDESSGAGSFGANPFGAGDEADESSGHSDDASVSSKMAPLPEKSPNSHFALAQKFLNGDFKDELPTLDDIEHDEPSDSAPGYDDDAFGAGVDDDESSGAGDFGTKPFDAGVDDKSSDHSDEEISPLDMALASKKNPNAQLDLARKLLAGDFEDDPPASSANTEKEIEVKHTSSRTLETKVSVKDSTTTATTTPTSAKTADVSSSEIPTPLDKQKSSGVSPEDQESKETKEPNPTPPEQQDDSESSEESSDEDESGSESDDDGVKPFKLVVKEAPLLRLENVTSMTRSKIPADRITTKKNTGKGWGAMFGFMGKSAAPAPAPSPLKKAEEVCPIEAPENSAGTSESAYKEDTSTVQSGQDERQSVDTDSGGPDIESLNGLPESVYDIESVSSLGDRNMKSGGSVSANSMFSVTSKASQASQSTYGTAETPSKSSAEAQTPVTTPSPGHQKTAEFSMKLPASSTLPGSQVMANAPKVSSPKSSTPVQSTQSTSANSSALITTDKPAEAKVKTSKSSKKKKKSKKNGLSSHLTKAARRVNNYGDEVSIGTMNLKEETKGQQHVVLAKASNLFDQQDESVKQRRPWGGFVSKKPNPEKGSTIPETILEEIDEIEQEIDHLHTAEMNFLNHEAFDADKKAPSEVVENTGESKEEGEYAEFSSEPDAEADAEQEAAQKAFDVEEDDFLVNPGDGLAELLELESKITNPEQEDTFEEMWDTVSCDASTTLEFERKQRNKIRQKKTEKQRSHELEKEREEMKAKEIVRLRLFQRRERDKEVERRARRRHKSRLSTEFLSAIHRVFNDEDDGEVDEDESFPEHEDLAVANVPGGGLARADSLMSLYITVKKSSTPTTPRSPVSPSNNSQDVGESEDEDNRDEDDEDHDGFAEGALEHNRSSRSNGSGSSRQGKDDGSRANSRASRKGKASLKSPRRKPKVNPTEIFEAELKKQQQCAKVLSISSLRQEMSDRRGTSVKLLQREFIERKKKKAHLATATNNNADDFDFTPRSAGDFGNGFRGAGEGGGDGDGFDEGFGAKPYTQNSDTMFSAKPESAERQGQVSRWAIDESISELDDLRTVRSEPEINHGLLGVAAGMVAAVGSNVSHGVHYGADTLQHGAQSLHDNVRHNVQSINIPAVPQMSKMPSVPTANLPTFPKKKTKKQHAADSEPAAFQATFNDMPMTTIGEYEEEDNEQGLLSSGDTWGDDGSGGGGGNGKPSRNREGGGRSFGLPKLKMPKGIGKFMPKIPGRSNSSNSGGFSGGGGGGVASMDLFGDDDGNGLLG